MARLFLAFALLIDRAALSHTCNVILIAGTGRAGTTFLVEELTALGAPTGFTEARIKGAQESHAHAGLESIPPMGQDGALGCSPQHSIFKSPSLTLRYKQWIHASNIEAVIIPIREAHSAAHLRAVEHELNTKTPRGSFFAGAHTEEEQLQANTQRVYDLIYALAEADIRTIFLAYPRHVQDASYSYSQLRDVLDLLNITKPEFVAKHNATFHADFVHSSLPNVTTARALPFSPPPPPPPLDLPPPPTSKPPPPSSFSPPQQISTILLPLLCSPRTGSSMTESFIGESPLVLELQEMYNHFSHSPIAMEATSFFSARRNASGPNFDMIDAAAAMAQKHRKRAVSYKIFGPMCSPGPIQKLFSTYGGGTSVVIVLERNPFTTFISGLKVRAGCSSFQYKVSTGCKLTVDIPSLESAIRSHLNTMCCHRRTAGVSPFRLSGGGPRHVLLRYEELETLPSMQAKFELVQTRVRTASPSALPPWRTNGNTQRRYTQQDQNHTLGSSVINLAEVQAWYTMEKAGAICRQVSASCTQDLEVSSLYVTRSLSATQDLVWRWCVQAGSLS